MKKTKRKAVINLIIFFLLLAGGIYMAIAGVGQNESGKTANVPLGLDLQGGLSVTYEIQDEKPTSDEIKATVDKLQRRVDAYSSEGEVYQEGNDRITVEIPLNTEKVDAHDVLDELGQPGQLLFLDSENYTIWQQNQNNGTNDAYEAVLTGSDIKNAQAGVDDSGTVKDYVLRSLQLQLQPILESQSISSMMEPLQVLQLYRVQSQMVMQLSIRFPAMMRQKALHQQLRLVRCLWS